MSKGDDTDYQEALALKRIEFARQLREIVEAEGSIARQSAELYSEILEELIAEVVLEVHREAKTGTEKQSFEEAIQQTRSAASDQADQANTAKGGPDIFGHKPGAGLNEEIVCSNCGRKIAAGRFAPHLEKCFGKGRNAARNGRRSS